MRSGTRKRGGNASSSRCANDWRLSDMTEGDRTLNEVLDAVAKHFEISREELVSGRTLLGPTRQQDTSLAGQRRPTVRSNSLGPCQPSALSNCPSRSAISAQAASLATLGHALAHLPRRRRGTMISASSACSNRQACDPQHVSAQGSRRVDGLQSSPISGMSGTRTSPT